MFLPCGVKHHTRKRIDQADARKGKRTHERNDNMTSENMMSELRRIVGTFAEQRKRAVAEAAKGDAQ